MSILLWLKFVTPTTLIPLFALDLPKSALIYSECQMNRSCCLLSLWPQNRSLNYLWTFLCLGCQKLPVWRRPQRCWISCPSFSKHRASNYPSLQLQAWRWSSMSPISECECYHHQSSTIHATTVMCISCSSMSVWYWHSTFITEHRSAHMTSSDALNSTSSISLPLLASYPVFFPLYSCLGCQQRMSWPHAAQASIQGWPPRLIFCHLLVWSPNHGWWWLVLAWFCIWSTTANVFTHSCMLAWNLILIQNLAFYLIDFFSTFKILNLYMYIIHNLYELFG